MTLDELLAHIKEDGWDWPDNDYAWLASKSGIDTQEPDGGSTSTFFIHSGRIRHQAHIPYGMYPLEDFISKLRERAKELDDPSVYLSDEEDCSFYLEGTRLPNEDDVRRLEAAKVRLRENDERELRAINRRLSVIP